MERYEKMAEALQEKGILAVAEVSDEVRYEVANQKVVQAALVLWQPTGTMK